MFCIAMGWPEYKAIVIVRAIEPGRMGTMYKRKRIGVSVHMHTSINFIFSDPGCNNTIIIFVIES